MRFLRRLGPAIRALGAHKVRTGLALASVGVGVAAVVVTSAIGAGVEREVLRQTDAMGSNLLVVRPAQVANSAARKTIRGVVTSLKTADCHAIATLKPVREAVPGFESNLVLKAGEAAMNARVLGTTAQYLDVARFRVHLGRFIDENDDENARRVAVLGSRVAGNLFEHANPCGQVLRVRGIVFQVIGVLESKGVLADGSDQDNMIVIPIRTALRRVFNSTWLNPVFVSVRDRGQMDHAAAEIATLLRTRHRLDAFGKPDDFAIQNKTQVLEKQKQVANSLALLTSGLAAVSLFVGGTGILALMLMSIRERTSEIGLRMAVGAVPSDILAQFLFEAVLLSLGGWAAGIMAGAAGAAVLAFTIAWKIAVPVSAILASFAMTAIAGVGFGWYPARKASLMPPIQALLVE